MKKTSLQHSGWFLILELILILSWLTNIRESFSYFFTNGLVAFAGMACALDNCRNPEGSGGSVTGMAVLSGVFSLSSLLANYDLFTPVTTLTNLFNLALSLAGGTVIAMNILLCLSRRLPAGFSGTRENPSRPGKWFRVCFLSIAALDLIYLVCSAWPGILTSDSMGQIAQIATGQYDNLNPYWHTQLIRLFVQPMVRLSGSWQLGVGVYSVFQILLTAAAFSYVLVTLYQRGFPRILLILVWAFYALVPYNIVYSVTMWKDIPFSLTCLILTVSLYRILNDMGKYDRPVFFLSGLGLCLLRTNGILVYGMLFAAMALIASFRKRKLLPMMAVVLVLGGLMQGPVLTLLGAAGGDFVETLSIPLQQVSRVICEGRELTPEEQALVEAVADTEAIREEYSSEISDPIKNLVRKSGGREVLAGDPGAYLNLWLRLGLRYPGDYGKAWVDQTKGYWNSGYAYWVFAAEGVFDNGFGITAAAEGNPVDRVIQMGIRYFQMIPFLQPLISIGLFTWLTVLGCFLLAKKKRPEWILALPAFAVLLGLMMGTPVYSEFRYAYPVILTCPLILSVVCFDPEAPAQI